MKQFVIATLVGALLVFVFQAMSWMVLPTHKDSMRYTPAQDSLLALMSRNLPGDGVYSLPYPTPEQMKNQEEQQKFHNSMIGKPWAIVQYHREAEDMSAWMMVHGFLFDLLAAAIIVWLLGAAGSQLTTFTSRFLAVLAFGAFVVLQSDLMAWNWWDTPGHYLQGEIIDHIVSWGICGIWLGWYLGRK